RFSKPMEAVFLYPQKESPRGKRGHDRVEKYRKTENKRNEKLKKDVSFPDSGKGFNNVFYSSASSCKAS
ncbi:MAG: hypothetical protein ACI3W6_07885, partial [Clostridia bacterium]